MSIPSSEPRKTAFAVWDGRIAPVFDTAGEFLLVEALGQQIVCQTDLRLEENQPAKNSRRLAELEVRQLVCGAISRSMQELVESQGIELTPFVAGDLLEIVGAWRDGCLRRERFSMPGCCHRGRCGKDGRRRLGAAATGTCRCPQCGQQAAHEPGVPCTQLRCSLCGSAMIRE